MNEVGFARKRGFQRCPLLAAKRRCPAQLLAAGGALAALIVAAGPRAVAAAEMSAADDHTAQQVSEVVVTAQKRSERLLSVPAPVTALSASQLARTESVRLEDYVTQVPGMSLMSDREGETQIILRGITTGSPVSSTVATYVDDTPYGSSTSFALGGWLTPDLDPSDLQRIEVLRGPQGTLYGASSLGGVVKFVTVGPNLNDYAGHVEFDGSSVDHGGDGYGARGMLNLPLVDGTLGLRVSAYDRTDPGYISDPHLGTSAVNENRVDGGRVALLWKPTADLSVELSAVLQDLNSKGSSDEDGTVQGSTFTPLDGGLAQIRYADEPLHVHYNVYSATVNDNLGWGSLVSITSYSTMHQAQIFDQTATFGALATGLTGIPNFGTTTGSQLQLNKFSEEVRLSSQTGQRLEWQGGLFFTHEQSNRDEPTYTFDTTTGAQLLPIDTLFFSSLISHYTEYAGFGDLTYHFTPKFDVLAGVRYSYNEQKFTTFQNGIFAGGASTQIGTSSDSSVTYLITPRYRFDANNMLYARIASGYRPGGPNAPTPQEVSEGVPNAYRPDTLTDYEIGYKASLLQRKLTLDLSAYYIDWRDIQIETNFGGITTNGNGGAARSDGFEAAAVLTPVQGLTIASNLAYTDAELTTDAPGVSGVKGDELPNVPKWAFNLSGDYEFPIAATVKGFVGGGLHYTGDRASEFVTDAPSGFIRPTLPAFTTVELRTGIDYRRWTLEIYAKNIGDVRGITNLTYESLNPGGNPYTAAVIQPRTVGVSLSASF